LLTILVLFYGCSEEPAVTSIEKSNFSVSNKSSNQNTHTFKFNDYFDLEISYSILENGYVDLEYELVLPEAESNYGFLDLRSNQIEVMGTSPNSFSFVGLSAEVNGIGSNNIISSYEHPNITSSIDGMADPYYLCECNDNDFDENVVLPPEDCLPRKYAYQAFYCDGAIICSYCSVVLLLGSERVYIGDSEVSEYQSGIIFFNP